ncbi:MAG: hypothetical protein ACTSQ8_27135 [Candidatus Helarchaeota archaeon]
MEKNSKVIVSLTAELDELWGVEDLIEDMKGMTRNEIEQAIIELIQEDIGAFLEIAKWSVRNINGKSK